MSQADKSVSRSFANRLIELREEQNWNTGELARRLQLTHAAVWQWETGSTLPRSQAIVELEAVFGLKPGDLRRLVDADRIARGQKPTKAPTVHRRTATAPAVEPRREPQQLRFDFDESAVDEFMFFASREASESFARMKALALLANEMTEKARELLQMPYDASDPSGDRAWREQHEAAVDLLLKAGEHQDEIDKIRAKIEEVRQNTLWMIQRTRHVVGEDTSSDEVPTEKVVDVARRRMERLVARRRAELNNDFTRLSESTNRWFLDESDPSDAVPLLVMLRNLANRVISLEAEVAELKLSATHSELKRQGKPAIGYAPQYD